MRNRVLLGLVLVLVLLAGVLVGLALGGDDDEPDQAASTTSSSPTPSTEAPSTTEPTAATPTVVVGPDGVLGWWDAQGWVQATADGPTPLQAGDQLRLLRLGQDPITSTSGAPVEPEEFCSTPAVDLEPGFDVDRPDARVGAGGIAVRGVREPQPRPVTILDPASARARTAGDEALAEVGIDADDPGVVQLVRADLDGDGTDEVVVVSERIDQLEPGPYGAAGDWSVVALRQVVDGEVRTTIAHEHRPRDEEGAYVLVARVVAVADLDGDGRMEVVLRRTYYEGGSTGVYELQDGRLVEVLTAGCGV